MTGKFVTLEGGEGAGKSTQAARLVAALAARQISFIRTREPGGTPNAERLRTVLLQGKAAQYGPMAEAILFSAARLDHLETLIRPALMQGTWVICDRFADSTRAYQGAAGALDSATIDALERVVVGTTRPDLTLILDVPPEMGLARAGRRHAQQTGSGEGLDRFERDSMRIHTARRQAFLAIAAGEPERCAVLDATQDVDTLEREIWALVESRLLASLMHPEAEIPAKVDIEKAIAETSTPERAHGR